VCAESAQAHDRQQWPQPRHAALHNERFPKSSGEKTVRTFCAVALTQRAVQLASARFPGDALEEACRFASREERLAVVYIVQSRPALFGQPAQALLASAKSV
jgi:hypothetical protein